MATTFHLSFERRPHATGNDRFDGILQLEGERDPGRAHLLLDDKFLGSARSQWRGESVEYTLGNTGLDGKDLLPEQGTPGTTEGEQWTLLVQRLRDRDGGPRRLVVHVPKQMTVWDAVTLETLPWHEQGELTGNGHLHVVFHPADGTEDPTQVLRAVRRVSCARREQKPELRVLIVVLGIDQVASRKTVHPEVRDTLVELRRRLDGAGSKLRYDIVAPQRVKDDLGDPAITPLATLDELRGILRGEESKLSRRGFDLLVFVGHSDAQSAHAGATPARRLWCGFHQRRSGGLADDDSLSAEQLAEDLQAERSNAGRTVLCVFDCCNVGSAFLRPVLKEVDHAIGTLGMIAPRFGAAWLGAFCLRLADGFDSVRDALWFAREEVRKKAKDLLPMWPQLRHWTAVDEDRPFGTAEQFAFNDYCHGLEPALRDIQGIWRGHKLEATAIDLEVARLGSGHRHEDRDEPSWGRGRTTLGSVLKQPGLYLLLGEPGGGKSTALRHEAWQMRKLLHDDLDSVASGLSVPVYFRLPDLLREKTGKLDLLRLLGHATAKVGHGQELTNKLQRQQERLVLLLDGWDEIPTKNQVQRAQELLDKLAPACRDDRLRVVVACRTTVRPPVVAEATELKVLRLDRGSQIEMLTRLFQLRKPDASATRTEAQAKALAGAVVAQLEQAGGSVAELVSIPLYLGLLGYIVEHRAPGSRREDLGELLQRIGRRHEFLEEAIECILEERQRDIAQLADEQEARKRRDVRKLLELLGQLAFDRLLKGGLQWPSRQALRRRVGVLEPKGKDNPRLERLGVLAPVSRGDQEGAWEFGHRCLLEGMAARHLAAEEKDDAAEREREFRARRDKALRAIEKLAAETRDNADDDERDPVKLWREPMALVAGYRAEQAPEWIEWLRKHEPTRRLSLAALALTDSEYVKPALLLATLQETRDADWEERRDVYEHMLPPYGSGARMLDVLVEFVRGYPAIDRAELWFIDQVFAKVAEEASTDDLRAKANGQRDELMRLVGVRDLPEDVVTLLTTFPQSVEQGDLESTYWRFIPNGYGWIGSPGEQASVDNELLTQVNIPKPLWLAEVPVTAALWNLFLGEEGADPEACRRGPPAMRIDWYQATMFARWLHVRLSDKLPPGYVIRLPQEWEWEYGARATHVEVPMHPPRFAFVARMRYPPPYGFAIRDGERIPVTEANLGECFCPDRDEPGDCGDPVRLANPWGLREMHRFLDQWCANGYGPYILSTEPQTHPVSEISARRRVFRGGSYGNRPWDCRTAIRRRLQPDFRFGDFVIGVRLCLGPPSQLA